MVKKNKRSCKRSIEEEKVDCENFFGKKKLESTFRKKTSSVILTLVLHNHSLLQFSVTFSWLRVVNMKLQLAQ